MNTDEKLQKILARAGLGSRRQIEGWIAEGRVQLNRQPAKLGDRAKPGDDIRLDGHAVRLAPATEEVPEVLCYHKPVGEICTRHDPEGRPTVFERLPRMRRGRWVAIGRLDLNTAGLLLFTTDGELANRLMHPAQAIEREYAVRVLGEVSRDILRRLSEGVTLEDGPARFMSIQDAGGEGANHWYHVILTEGRQREVRRLWESQGLQVSRLIRIRFGPVLLPKGLRMGQSAKLLPEEVQALMQTAGLAPSALLPQMPGQSAQHQRPAQPRPEQQPPERVARHKAHAMHKARANAKHD